MKEPDRGRLRQTPCCAGARLGIGYRDGTAASPRVRAGEPSYSVMVGKIDSRADGARFDFR
jgi:hypothetical protein